jgi:hypothetical protein
MTCWGFLDKLVERGSQELQDGAARLLNSCRLIVALSRALHGVTSLT